LEDERYMLRGYHALAGLSEREKELEREFVRKQFIMP
jgi:hypothetical protein